MTIDMHSHIVFGVDDGADSLDTSVAMLKEAAESGTGAIISTPHIAPGLKRFDTEKYKTNLAVLQDFCRRELPQMKLFQGGEILYTDSLQRFLREKRILTLAGSYCVLIEFPGKIQFEGMRRAAGIIADEGYTPVFAHIERYSCLRSLGKIRKLREESGALMQVNANTIVAADRFFGDRFVLRAMKAGLVDFAASDAHNLSNRNARLDQCAEVLDKKIGKDFRKRVLGENQRDFLFF